MNYMQYIKGDDANGVGMRCTLFVSGCEMGCVACHNKESWKLTAGQKYTTILEDQIIEDLKSPFIDGLSLSGGNPTHPKNFDTVMELCKRVKKETGKSIWLWTGYTLEQIQNDLLRQPILSCIDYLVDGKFDISQSKNPPPYRGSHNQVIHTLINGISVEQN